MKLPSYFSDFLAEIRPTESDKEDYQTGHKTLTKRLKDDNTLSGIIISTFLQGSIRRATAVRAVNGTKADVDVVVVTKLSQNQYTPQQAMNVFVPFLDKWYKGKYKFNSRSIKIELSYVEMDLVITSAPSESQEGILRSDSITSDFSLEEVSDWAPNINWITPEKRVTGKSYLLKEFAHASSEWKSDPLYIPDRDMKIWEKTHPIAQIEWTWQKNKSTNSHYVNIVKALKWWRRANYPDVKYPKGYPLEHLIGNNCPDGIGTIAEGVTYSLESIANTYLPWIQLGIVPNLPDRGVPEHNVLHRLSFEDFKAFYLNVCDAAKIAREAFDEENLDKSVEGWRLLFGNKFPQSPASESNNLGGYSPRKDVSVVTPGRFA